MSVANNLVSKTWTQALVAPQQIPSVADVIPVIDEFGTLPGFYIATGFSGHGFGIGPGAGKAIAGMLTGADSGIPLNEFHLSRFFDGTK